MFGIFKKKNKKVEPVKAEPAKVESKPVENKKPTATTQKPVAKKTTKKAPTNIYYLTARKKDGKKIGWEVKRGNAKAVSALCDTKEEAMEKVKALAKSSKATVKIYKADGTVEKTYKIN